MTDKEEQELSLRARIRLLERLEKVAEQTNEGVWAALFSEIKCNDHYRLGCLQQGLDLPRSIKVPPMSLSSREGVRGDGR